MEVDNKGRGEVAVAVGREGEMTMLPGVGNATGMGWEGRATSLELRWRE